MRLAVLVQELDDVVLHVDGFGKGVDELSRAGGGFDWVVVVVEFDFLDGVEAVAGAESVDADADAGLGAEEESA